MVGQHDENLLSDILPIYYNRLFPQNLFCRWLACGSSPQPLCNRELSFTLPDDIYLRYLSISNQKELQILLQKKCPNKLDIGGVYNTKPNLARNAVVLARELVFDIDLTDYDEVRTCCQEAKVCEKCWKFMVIACDIIDKTLKEDFGFQCILWVFSGRRGVHCWVSDYKARTLDSPGRGAIAEYLSLITGSDSQNKKVHLGNNDCLHTRIRKSLNTIDKYFEDLIADQEFLGTPDRLKTFLKIIPDESLRSQVEKNLETMPASSLERWKKFESVYESYCRESSNAGRKIKYLLEEIKIQFCYPRLDVNVTKGFNHLLKSPFSIHPKTGKVSVVFKPGNAKNMKLDEIPTIYSLLDDSHSDHALHETNMRTAVKNFQEVVFSLEKAEALRRKKEASNSIKI